MISLLGIIVPFRPCLSPDGPVRGSLVFYASYLFILFGWRDLVVGGKARPPWHAKEVKHLLVV